MRNFGRNILIVVALIYTLCWTHYSAGIAGSKQVKLSKSLINSNFVKARRFSTGKPNYKPFIFVDRVRGRIYSSLKFFSGVTDQFESRPSKIFKKGITYRRSYYRNVRYCSMIFNNRDLFKMNSYLYKKKRFAIESSLFTIKYALNSFFSQLDPVTQV